MTQSTPRGCEPWVHEMHTCDSFVTEACDNMWRLSRGEYNNWALYMPALIHTITVKISERMREHTQSVADRQMTMIDQLMRTLELEQTYHPEWTPEEQQAFEQSLRRRCGLLDASMPDFVDDNPFNTLPENQPRRGETTVDADHQTEQPDLLIHDPDMQQFE